MSTWKKEIVTEGKGPTPKKGDKVTVHCTGYGKNNDLSKKFWSTKDPGQKPFTFAIGQGNVISAWDEGVMTMKIGERAKITAPPHCAYGKGGFPSWGIMPNSTLIFDIELLSSKGMVRASHILVKHQESRRLASWKDPAGVEIKKRTVQDADNILEGYLSTIKSASDAKSTFAEIAKKNSDCGSAKNGGDLGPFGPGDMQKAFEDGTYSLKVGEISGIIHSASGSHIIMRTG
uniref:Peptidyl-prolyl cis-trans isomerase n=1 Tax=Lotharella oceanica TaxID=641309 RepID=A0A7S2XKE8_9EUKA|mmetsp:Transcript_8834/g.17310  ORF Transcript_8834/g.17310 Transcript_8834/m.17310 type:complete len:232 (+) Transcript_8834:84-779(+)|eukprot:CAMPEP_0170177260 /NCGR_PEP_ID=MMETSP0040_2-20121228/9946_1 /TAXON_ID=641309 /ORGANISM="Lotharella oceanica, Strain CCMP622" /LENGTH=231 /DNA_ID=CAMNT_0010419845 /DNA_START=71 /DNA_END=766 /DNA_ORIENTATION=-